jgi:hypothetical protein
MGVAQGVNPTLQDPYIVRVDESVENPRGLRT